MADLKVNNITNYDGTTGPVIAGVSTVLSTSHFVVPVGNTFKRSVTENIVNDGLVLYLDAGNDVSYDAYENLLTYSEQFDNAAWNKTNASVTPNATVAPDGTATADKLVEGTGNTYFYIVNSASGGNQYYTYSLFVKQAETNRHLYFEVGNAYVAINLSTGTVFVSPATFSTGWSNPTVNIVSYPNGWYRCSITALADNTVTSVSAKIHTATLTGGAGGIVYTGDGTSGIYIWGAQIERGSVANTYYPTTGATKTRGTTLIDLSGNNNTGTLTNGPTYSTANGGSIVFDGVDDYVIVSSNASSIPYGSSARTISIWFYTNTTTWVDNSNNLFFYGAGNAGNAFGIDFSTYPSMEVYTWGSGTNDFLFSTTYSQVGWKNITVTYNGATTILIYENGVFTQTFALSSVRNTTTSDVYIGAINPSALAGGYYDGRIATTQIYNRALSAAEIQQNFNATRSRYGI